MDVVNLSKVFVQLKAIRVRRYHVRQSVKEYPLDQGLESESTKTIQITGELNKYIWEQRVASATVPPAHEWREEPEFLEVSLGFECRAGTGKTDWVPTRIIVKIHPTFGRRVDRVQPS